MMLIEPLTRYMTRMFIVQVKVATSVIHFNKRIYPWQGHFQVRYEHALVEIHPLSQPESHIGFIQDPR